MVRRQFSPEGHDPFTGFNRISAWRDLHGIDANGLQPSGDHHFPASGSLLARPTDSYHDAAGQAVDRVLAQPQQFGVGRIESNRQAG